MKGRLHVLPLTLKTLRLLLRGLLKLVDLVLLVLETLDVRKRALDRHVILTNRLLELGLLAFGLLLLVLRLRGGHCTHRRSSERVDVVRADTIERLEAGDTL